MNNGNLTQIIEFPGFRNEGRCVFEGVHFRGYFQSITKIALFGVKILNFFQYRKNTLFNVRACACVLNFDVRFPLTPFNFGLIDLRVFFAEIYSKLNLEKLNLQ